MKYTVTINEKSRSITVTLADGTKGVARCNPSDRFDINTGVELALERAKVAQTNKQKPTTPTSVMELVKALEKALPKGQMVIVGNGDGMTKEQKAWLHSLTDCKGGNVCWKEVFTNGFQTAQALAKANGGCSCDCEDCDEDDDCYTEDEVEALKSDAYDEGYDDGYSDGEAHKDAEIAEAYDEGYADAIREMKEALANLD